ncbi:hypothetical protein C5S31_04510 [ANME-1 cluster archaeon GoMg2]|nr:hypothetical protein [ANME-1 cluster archaeon GoMg2]
MKLKNKGLTMIVLSSFLLLAILSIVATAEAAGYDYTLPDVMKGNARDLSAEVRGAGGHTGKCIQVTIYNSAGVTKTVKVPIGTRLEPKDKGVQPMYTAGGEVLRAGPGTSSHSINAFCGDMYKSSPGTRDVFSFGGYAGSDLMNILGAINEQGAYNTDGQHAVWHNTDDRDISNDAGAQAIIDGFGPSAGAAAAAAAATCVLAAVWGILNGLANVGTSSVSSGGGGGGTAGGTSISPLIDPDTGEQLTVHDGNYEGGKPGQVWYDGQWVDKGTAAQWIAERRDELTQRQHERESFWSDAERDREQRIKDRAGRLRDEGYVYDPAQDAWVPGHDRSVIEQQRLQEAQQLNDFIERNVDDQTRTDFLQDLVDRVRFNGGDMDKLSNAIKDNIVGTQEHQAALAEAAELQGYEDTAAGIRDWTQRANRVIGWATGAGSVTNAVQNGAYSAIQQGFEQGYKHGVLEGVKSALTSAAASVVDELVEDYTHVPGTGTAFRDAYGTGYEKDKDGNWTSPIDRFASSLWHVVADQYDPTKYIDRYQEADGLGDYFDIGMDAVEAIGDIRDFGGRVQDAYDRGIQIGDTGGKLPIINGSKDGEFSRRGGDEVIDNITGRSDRDIPDGLMTEKTQRMADGITTDNEGNPHARLDDVLEIQRSTQDTRSLKNGGVDSHVREGFKNTLQEQVYDPHDDALKDYVRNNVPGMENRELRVHDFRTPGADSSSNNTDRDYHVQYKDDKGDWIEINRRRENVTSVRADDGSVKVVNKETVYDWEKFSQEKFAELTGYDSDKVRDSLPIESQRQAWDNLSDTDKKARWAEMHSQAATDKYHTEASPDYSDQVLNKSGDQIQKKDDAGESRANIQDVEEGGGTLDDPRALADMYHEKADVYLRQGNEAEAIAQIKKGVDTLEKVRSGYEQQGLDVGKLPADIQDGMKIISDAKVDHRADPAFVERELQKAGFGGIDDFNRKLSGQIESMKFAQEPTTSVAPEPPSAPETSGASQSSISTRIHWQDFKENEKEITNSFAEMTKDFTRRRNK